MELTEVEGAPRGTRGMEVTEAEGAPRGALELTEEEATSGAAEPGELDSLVADASDAELARLERLIAARRRALAPAPRARPYRRPRARRAASSHWPKARFPGAPLVIDGRAPSRRPGSLFSTIRWWMQIATLVAIATTLARPREHRLAAATALYADDRSHQWRRLAGANATDAGVGGANATSSGGGGGGGGGGEEDLLNCGPGVVFDPAVAESTKWCARAWALFQVYLGIPIMLGGTNNFTLMLFFNAFSIAGLPLLAGPIKLVLKWLKGDIPFEAGLFITLNNACLAGMNAASVNVQEPPFDQLKTMAATLGILASSFAQGFYVQYIAEALAKSGKDQYLGWAMLSTAGAFAAVAMAMAVMIQKIITILICCVMGSFLIVGAVSGLIGGGSISLQGMMSGTFGACDYRGYLCQFLWANLVGSSVYLHATGKLKDDSKADILLRKIFKPVYDMDDKLEKAALGIVHVAVPFDPTAEPADDAPMKEKVMFKVKKKQHEVKEKLRVKGQAMKLLLMEKLNPAALKRQMEEVRALQKKFDDIDADDSGVLDVDELKEFLVRILPEDIKVTDEEVAKMMQDADSDGSETLDFEEFLAMFAKVKTGQLVCPSFKKAVVDGLELDLSDDDDSDEDSDSDEVGEEV